MKSPRIISLLVLIILVFNASHSLDLLAAPSKPAPRYVPPSKIITIKPQASVQSKPTKYQAPAPPVKLEESPSIDNRIIQRLIRQLDADTYAERQEATEKLKEAGISCIAPLEEATKQGSAEVISRSIEILKHYTFSGDPSLSQAAFAGLKNISTAENKTAAQLASDAIKELGPKQFGSNTPRFQVPNRAAKDLHPLIPFVPNQQVANNFRSITVQRINGALSVKVVEPERKVQINQNQNQKITIVITDNAGQSKEIEAENLEQLKQNDVEAFELFNRYTKQGARPDNLFKGPRMRGIPRFGEIDPFAEIEKELKEMQDLRIKLQEDLK